MKNLLGVNMLEIYNCLYPGGTYFLQSKVLKSISDDFATLVAMTDMDDAVYKRLSELGFKVNEDMQDLRAAIPRGKVCPDTMDKATVELDAMIWITEQLAEIQSSFLAYELIGKIIVFPEYEPNRDVIIFFMRPILHDDIEDILRFLPINKWVTVMYALLTGSLGIIATLSILLAR